MNHIEKAVGQVAQGPSVIRPLSLRENLEHQLQSATENVARLQEALSLLDSNPSVSRLLELLGRSY